MNITIRYGILAIAGLILAFYNPLVHLAANYNRDIAIAGTAIYASLRSLTAVMSIVRDADVQASIGVASIVTSPGQALQPVIGTLERMSDLLFTLVVASGVLGFALPIVSSLGGILLAAGAGAKAVYSAFGRPLNGAGYRLARSAVTLGVFAAVCIPLAYAFAFVLGDRYTAYAWSQATEVFEKQAKSLSVEGVVGVDTAATPKAVSEPDDEKSAEGGGVLDWALDRLDGAVKGSTEAVQDALSATTGLATAIRDQIAASAKVVTDSISMAADLFNASVDIGVAYLVKLIVLPILMLLGIVWLFRALIQSGSEPIQDRSVPRVSYLENNPKNDARD